MGLNEVYRHLFLVVISGEHKAVCLVNGRQLRSFGIDELLFMESLPLDRFSHCKVPFSKSQ